MSKKVVMVKNGIICIQISSTRISKRKALNYSKSEIKIMQFYEMFLVESGVQLPVPSRTTTGTDIVLLCFIF
jgi:hypothetical protein